MAKTEGYIQFVCDRCNKVLYATKDAPQTQSWKEISRVGADGAEIHRTLCDECSNKYYEFARKQDEQFITFMTQKESE